MKQLRKWEKTKYIVIRKEQWKCKVQIKVNLIKQLMIFKYLGFKITNEGRLYTEVRRQAAKASRMNPLRKQYEKINIWPQRATYEYSKQL